MPQTLTFTGELVIVSCWCGIRCAIPDSMYRWAKKDPKNAVHCPLGHEFVYRTSEADQLREQLQNTEARLAQERARRDQAEASAAAEAERARAALAESQRTRRRLAGGACPCCNRTFTNLARHMAGQHPDFTDLPELPAALHRWPLVRAVATVVAAAGEPLTPNQVLGRLVLAGLNRHTERQVTAALYNAKNAGLLNLSGPKTFSAVSGA